VLSDRKLRDLYDRGKYTGKVVSPEDQAKTRLTMLFSSVVDKISESNATSTDVVSKLKKAIETTRLSITEEISTLEKRIRVLTEINNRLSGKDSTLNDVVEHKISETKKVIAEGEEMINTLKIMENDCDGYTYNYTTEPSRSNTLNWDDIPSLLTMLYEEHQQHNPRG
jgi:hypothetical protein